MTAVPNPETSLAEDFYDLFRGEENRFGTFDPSRLRLVEEDGDEGRPREWTA